MFFDETIHIDFIDETIDYTSYGEIIIYIFDIGIEFYIEML